MSLNVTAARNFLHAFDFQQLFREELGWNNPKQKQSVRFQTKGGLFFRKTIAELSGASVFEITSESGNIPDPKIRQLVSIEIQKITYHHILIFVDTERTQSIWRWIKKRETNNLPREHYFAVGQSGDLFISKLSALLVEFSEIENDITITDVAKKIQKALDVEQVTKRFYKEYQQQFVFFLDLIVGIDNEADRRWYASVILNRLMFIYFLQQKGFINNGDDDYLYSKLKQTQSQFGNDKYYSKFLSLLFFEGFAKPENHRSISAKNILGEIKYLNGGLFLKHKIEEKYPNIQIPDLAFENLLKSDEPKGLFEQFSWNLDDKPGAKDNEINPDVLGYIFEKYINQKAYGAYYTRPGITEYLCEQTIYKLILDAVNEVSNNKGTQSYESIDELLLNIDPSTCRLLLSNNGAIIPNLSLLDPACGSGAFLVAAMKTLINIYSAILGRIDFLGDADLLHWKNTIQKEHPSINYFIKKEIITNNLYGVDIMEEASEIAKLRLFLALVSSADTIDHLEPLPNIDFNIMSGNSLVGMMRVDENQFNKHYEVVPQKNIGKVVKAQTLFTPGLIQGNIFAENHAKGYQQLIDEREASITAYKNAHSLDLNELQSLRNKIQKQEHEASEILNKLLLQEFSNLKINHESFNWDKENNRIEKGPKRAVMVADIETLEPFHWGYEFSEIFRKKNGFDAIITNPPWEVFQTNEKEFFHQFDATIKKKKLRIEDWEVNKEELMQDAEVSSAWLKYLSLYPHQWAYFKKSLQYINQTSTVDGKTVGNKPNLYCLFLEQCKNLLKDNGYCGIVIPSGIYTDLGTKQLREMLFEETNITGLFCFENRKEIFENVHRSFKFVILSFEKGKSSNNFPAAFMHQDVDDLLLFPKHGAVNLSVDIIKKFSPDSYSIIEVKNETEFQIVNKAVKFPQLSDKSGWDISLYGEEMNMTRSKGYFVTEPTKYSLFEGGMMHQFNDKFSEPRYWLIEENIRKDFLSKKTKRIVGLSKPPADLKNDYETYRLAIRKIARNTDSRTLISCILPKYSLVGNSLSVNFPYHHTRDKYNELKYSYSDLLLLVSLLNSFVVDFLLRLKVTANLNLFYLDQIPTPRLSKTNKWYKEIICRAAKLTCTSSEYSDLWENVMHDEWQEENRISLEERNVLRAEMDGIIANVYGLSEIEYSYILSTFPIVQDAQKQMAMHYYNEVAKHYEKNIDDFHTESVDSTNPNQRMKEFGLDEGIYTIQDVVQITRLPAEKVSRWFKELSNENYEGLKGNKAEHHKLKISFHGIVELVVIGTLRDNKFPLKKILAARADLKDKTRKIYPFATNNVRDNLKVAGKSLIFKFGEDIVTLDGTGQFNLTIIVSFFKFIDFDTEGLALRLFPLKDSKLIIVDPKLGGGKAVINNGEAIWAETVALAYQGEDSIGMISEQYSISRDEILAAVSYLN